VIQCPSCGKINPEEYKHCGTCGTALVVAPKSQSAPDYASHPSYRDHRTMESDSPSSSRRARMILFGIIAVGLVFGCAVCLCGGALLSWSTLTAPAASAPLPTRTPRALAPAASASLIASASTPSPQDSISLAPPALQNSSAITPTAATGLKQWTTAQVLAAFKAARLEAANPRPMSQEDYGQVPMVATEAIRFFVPSLGGTKGGHVYSFATDADLETVRKYYQNGSGAAKPPWIFVRDNILVQLNGELSSAQAQRYQSALKAMK
jgi:hypothetical protein